MSEPQLPFVRKATVDKPGIIGAQWWQDSVASQVPRRSALKGLVALGGLLAAAAALGTCISAIAKPSSSTPPPPDVRFEPRASLEMQKKYGWDFGAEGEALVFDGRAYAAFNRNALVNMPSDLAPADPRYAAFFVPTLFQSPSARPTQPRPVEGQQPYTPLDAALVPISTPSMDVAFAQGRALAELLAGAQKTHPRVATTALVVDLPGPESVAFAAGAASYLDPVFLFDNWPHPRGVVPAHRTLAAAAYYQPLFARAKTARSKGALPLFVLDRARLTTYTDEATQFDNRHLARLPSASALTGLGIKDVVYVGPNAMTRAQFESDDLIDDFLAFPAANVKLHAMPPSAFAPLPDTLFDAGSGDHYGYAGEPRPTEKFWQDWDKPAASVGLNDVSLYAAAPRTTPYSRGMPTTPTTAGARRAPDDFGYVPVAVAAATGVIVGARMARSGSWNRTTQTTTGS